MFVFCFEFPGVWIGGTAVVVAEDQQQALLLLRQKIAEEMPNVRARYQKMDERRDSGMEKALDQFSNWADLSDLPDDEFKCVRTMSFNSPTVFISDNGDY